MAQLVLAAVHMVCGLPAAPIIGPLIMAINPINPINIITYIAWLLGLKLTKAAWAKKLAPTWKKAAAWAVLFYFITVLPLYVLLIVGACHAAG